MDGAAPDFDLRTLRPDDSHLLSDGALVGLLEQWRGLSDLRRAVEGELRVLRGRHVSTLDNSGVGLENEV